MVKQKDLEGIIVNLNQKARKLYKDSKCNDAFACLDKALLMLVDYQQPVYWNLCYKTYTNYAVMLKRQREYSRSLKYYELATKFVLTVPELLADNYLSICLIYSLLSDHRKSLLFAIKAEKILKGSKSPKLLLVYQYAGVAYEHLNMKKEALKMYEFGYIVSLKLSPSQANASMMFKNRIEILAKFTDFPDLIPCVKSPKVLKKKNLLKKRANLTPDPVDMKKLPEFITTPISMNSIIQDFNSQRNYPLPRFNSVKNKKKLNPFSSFEVRLKQGRGNRSNSSKNAIYRQQSDSRAFSRRRKPFKYSP